MTETVLLLAALAPLVFSELWFLKLVSRLKVNHEVLYADLGSPHPLNPSDWAIWQFLWHHRYLKVGDPLVATYGRRVWYGVGAFVVFWRALEHRARVVTSNHRFLPDALGLQLRRAHRAAKPER